MRDWLYPGAQVVCVDAVWHDEHPDDWPCPLVEGAIYTVIDVLTAPAPGIYKGNAGHLVAILAEVKNPRRRDGRDLGFAIDRFRPLTKRKTSIAIFERMLNSTPETVEVE